MPKVRVKGYLRKTKGGKKVRVKGHLMRVKRKKKKGRYMLRSAHRPKKYRRKKS